MVYQTTIPQPGDDLDVSVTDIQQNFLTANTVMDVDHYPFDNLTTNKGFHKTVTSPDQVTDPATTTAPKLYGLQPSVNFGTMQFSRGPSNAVPSPLTNISGGPVSLNAGATTNLLDFTGLNRVMCVVNAFNDTGTSTKNPVNSFVAFSQNIFSITSGSSGVLTVASSGTILQLKNNTPSTLSNVYWTIEFVRIE